MTRGVQFKRRMQRLLIHLILIIFSIIMIVPFVWMTLTAFKTVTEATSVSPFVIFPSQWRTDAFTTVWNNMNFLVLYKNTLLLIFFRVVCACLTATLAGYAFARLKFKGRDFMFSLILFQMMIPSQIFIIPQFLMISKMGLTNTMFALVFPGIVTAFGTFLLKQAYMGLPGDLEEAARLDGCNIPKTFVFVMAPLARSSMVALGIFTAVFAFKDLMWPLVVNSSANKMPLSAALATMQGQYQSNYPQLMAASLIFMYTNDRYIPDIPEAVRRRYCNIRWKALKKVKEDIIYDHRVTSVTDATLVKYIVNTKQKEDVYEKADNHGRRKTEDKRDGLHTQKNRIYLGLLQALDNRCGRSRGTCSVFYCCVCNEGGQADTGCRPCEQLR